MYCWGLNGFGQLGDGTTISKSVPVAVSGMSSGVTAIDAGMFHTCAIQAGAAYCWGLNSDGRIGDGTGESPKTVPAGVQAMSSDVISIVCSYYHTCALTSNGAMYCWGQNDYGQLGDGTQAAFRLTAGAVSGMTSGVTLISAGAKHTCAVKSGQLYCWGRNEYGESADGDVDSPMITPVTVGGMPNVTDLSCGNANVCVVNGPNGIAYCWGYNNEGQVGDGTIDTPRVAPVSLASTNFFRPTSQPSSQQSQQPSSQPSRQPSRQPSGQPTQQPTIQAFPSI
jgi:alpha-tubulin suppressor-like RCC1 family protein